MPSNIVKNICEQWDDFSYEEVQSLLKGFERPTSWCGNESQQTGQRCCRIPHFEGRHIALGSEGNVYDVWDPEP
jgi:hypothetical protein